MFKYSNKNQALSQISLRYLATDGAEHHIRGTLKFFATTLQPFDNESGELGYKTVSDRISQLYTVQYSLGVERYCHMYW